MQNVGINFFFCVFSLACLIKALNVELETISKRQSKSQTNWRAFLRQKNRAREMITRAKRERAKNRFIVLSARTGNLDPFPRACYCETLVRVIIIERLRFTSTTNANREVQVEDFSE